MWGSLLVALDADGRPTPRAARSRRSLQDGEVVAEPRRGQVDAAVGVDGGDGHTDPVAALRKSKGRGAPSRAQ